MVEEPQLMEQCIQIQIFPEWFRPILPQNTLHPMHYAVCWLSPTLQRQRDADTLFFLRFYTTRQRVSELADIRMRDVRLDSPAAITYMAREERFALFQLMKQTVELLQSYFTENGITPPKSPDMPLFWSGNYRKLTRSELHILSRSMQLRHRKSQLIFLPLYLHMCSSTQKPCI